MDNVWPVVGVGGSSTPSMTPQPNSTRRTCDIVMKGGITSGVVYPHAITTLAQRFDFRNIGGTSAGAIAAAVAAAAEFRRQTAGSEAGFAQLGRLPALLGEKHGAEGRTRLFFLFQPNTGTRRLFAVFTSALGGGAKAVQTVLWKLLQEYAGWAVAGALPGLALAILSAAELARGGVAWLWVLVSLVLAAVGALVGAAAGFAREFLREVPRNGYGLCSGVTDSSAPKPDRSAEPLTQWLTGFLNETAGFDPAGRPLTFSDLWGTGESDPEKASRRINLEMMTTNLTHRRPYRLPFRDDEDLRENYLFYFRPEEFRRLFPEPVVQWMLDHPRPHGDDPRRIARRQALGKLGYHPLPAPADLPVVVATRMSLSFPILLSAVPLHSIDRGPFPENEQPERCWFSDGGICSNFPLHFFDTALPRRPTFSIDLSEKPPGTPKEALHPEMDAQNSQGIRERWHRFDTEIPATAGAVPAEKSDPARLFGFVWAIIATMQNWTDATQGRLPGYRDRIVRVPLTPDEGGLNLDMPKERIDDLTQRGAEAGELLLEHFDVPARHDVMTWDNHRWIRLRAYLAALEKSLKQLDAACGNPENGDVDYETWLKSLRVAVANAGPAAPSYPMNEAQIQAALTTLDWLRGIPGLWSDSSAAASAPRPRPMLRPRAQV